MKISSPAAVRYMASLSPVCELWGAIHYTHKYSPITVTTRVTGSLSVEAGQALPLSIESQPINGLFGLRRSRDTPPRPQDLRRAEPYRRGEPAARSGSMSQPRNHR